MRILAHYRKPVRMRSLFELVVTFVPFALLWAAAWWALSIGYWLSLAISVPAAAFLVRLFMIQHDCGHGAFFKERAINDWVGRAIGILTLTPYDVWRRSHSIHHASSGNLDKRGTGDIHTLTVREYQALSPLGRLAYRFYRHPIALFGFGPIYLFLFQNRLPIGFMSAGRIYWISAMGTNAATVLIAGLMIYLVGLVPFLQIYLPITLMAGAIGMWLFYVQHQFEETSWDHDEDWQLHDAALHGSSHYRLPGILRWMTANIGVHHVHHLNSRIPFYRLQQVLRDHPALTEVRQLTLLESFACVKLQLWDENRRRLVSYVEARNC
jgi:omega-6 fatty acid desaturase (delta-12 desaturase)